MKVKSLIAIATVAAAGYLIVKGKTRRELERRLAEENLFENYSEKNIYSSNVCAMCEED